MAAKTVVLSEVEGLRIAQEDLESEQMVTDLPRLYERIVAQISQITQILALKC